MNDLEAILIKEELKWKPRGSFWLMVHVLSKRNKFTNKNITEIQLKESDTHSNLTCCLITST